MSEPRQRHLVLVVGVGRSGTSLLSGMLAQLGFHIPQPEVQADDTNPRGFGEPRWVVDFHMRLLRERTVTVNDARPAAWERTGAAAELPTVHGELLEWLGGELQGADAVVIKDPRTVWFLPLWMRCAADLGVPVSFVTMLRHPGEIIASARRSYGTWQTDASRAAAWLNVMLETEAATRSARRAFVRYEDLLADWESEVGRLGGLLELPQLSRIDRVRFAEVDRFVDPTLHRNRVGWDELTVPASVRDIAEDVWRLVQSLALPGGDTCAAWTELDRARSSYIELYAEAEAIAQSSVTAAKRRPRRGGGAAAGKATASAPASLRVRLARRVPAPYRRRVRRALRSLRRATRPRAAG
jgi:hypothetical protein